MFTQGFAAAGPVKRRNRPLNRTSPLMIVAATLRTDAQAAEVIAALAAEQTPCIVLKGRAFAELLYPAQARGYDDTDLLVPAHRSVRAGSVLRGLGYAPRAVAGLTRPGTPHAQHWDRPRDGAHIDLHERPDGVTGDARLLWDVLSAHAVPLTLGGQAAHGLDRPASGMLCALHLAAHGRSAKPLEDLRRALALLTAAEWEAAYGLAVELEAEEAFGAGLRFLPEGSTLADRFGMAALSAERLLQVDPDAPSSARALHTLLAQRSFPSLARAVRAVLLPPPNLMRRHSRLARRGRAGLLAAYTVRPLRVVRLLPRALWFWARARGAAKGTSPG